MAVERGFFQYKKAGIRSRAVAVLASAGAAAGVIACGGGNSEEQATSVNPDTPVVTQTIEPTPKITATLEATPIVTEVPKSKIMKLSEALYAPTEFVTVVASIDSAYQLHPNAGVMNYQGTDIAWTRDYLNNNIQLCRIGDPSQGPKFVDVDRFTGCYGLIIALQIIHQETGYPEFHQGAVDAANYYLTVYPQFRAKLDQSLTTSIKDTSPHPGKG